MALSFSPYMTISFIHITCTNAFVSTSSEVLDFDPGIAEWSSVD